MLIFYADKNQDLAFHDDVYKREDIVFSKICVIHCNSP